MRIAQELLRALAARLPRERLPLAEGERIVLGDVVLEIMETPGHTPESISVLVFEHDGDEVPYGALTGDALFIGDVGRPDLLASIGVTAEELGRMLYDSVQNKLMGLPDAYRLPARRNDAYRLLGDGVAAPVVRFLSDHLLLPLIAAQFEDAAALAPCP